jgi:4-amino-4-deoxy-L-arabinose transferase-like glycosyltransferase
VPTAEARTRSDRWSRSSTAVVGVVLGIVLVSNFIWLARDHQAPAWDQAHYLHVSFQWRHALSAGGFGDFVSSFYDTDPGRAPLYVLVITPFEAIREGVDAAIVANTFMLCGTVLAAAVVAARLYGRRAAPAAAIFVATCPMMFGLSRTPLVDTLLTMLVALAVVGIVVSEGFQRRSWAILAGAFVGLAMLTKLTAPGFVIAPALISFALPERILPRRQATNMFLAAAVAVLIALPWYGVNLDPALDYLRSTTSGDLAMGITDDPLDFRALQAYTARVINSALGVILLLVLVVAGALASRRLLQRRVERQVLARIAIPASWFIVPFAAQAVSHNQDIRLVAPGAPGVAVLAAGAIVAIRPRRMGIIVLSGAAAALAFQFMSFVASFPSRGSAVVTAGPASFRLTMPFDGTSLEYARRPDLPDYAVPIVHALGDDRVRGASGAAPDVCLLETNEVVNGNTLRYVAEAEAVPVTFTDLGYVPHLSDDDLRATLARCRAALYVLGDEAPGRVAVLNRSSAAARLAAADLAGFDGPRERFPVGGGLTAQLLRRAL